MAENILIGIGVDSAGSAEQIVKVESLLQKLNVTTRQLKAAALEGSAGLDKIRAGAAQAQADLARGAGGIEGMAKSLRGLNQAAGTLLSIGALKSFVADVVQTSAKLDGVRRAFQVITGDAKSAGQSFDFVAKTANTLGLDLLSAEQAFVKLQASAKGTALEGKPTEAVFTAVSRAAAALGLSADQADGALLAISQMMSKGRVAAEELRGQLGERLPGAFNLMARALGVSTAELDQMLQKGQVLATDALPKFAAELDKTYANARFDGIQNNLNRLSTSWTQFKDAVANADLTNAVLGALQAQVEQATEDVALLQSAGQKIGELRRRLFGSSAADRQAETNAQTEAIRAETALRQQAADTQARLVELGKQRELAALGEVRQAAAQSTDERIKALKSLMDARRNEIRAAINDAVSYRQKAAEQLASIESNNAALAQRSAGRAGAPVGASLEAQVAAIKARALDSGNLEGVQGDIRQAQEQATAAAGKQADAQYAVGAALRKANEQLTQFDKLTDPAQAEAAAQAVRGYAQAVRALGDNLASAGDQTFFDRQATDIENSVAGKLATLNTQKAQEADQQASAALQTLGQLQAQISQIRADAATIPIDLDIAQATEKLSALQKQIDALPAQKTIDLQVGGVGEAPQAALAAGGYARLGGRLPGYGGGDRIRALLEAGEFVLRKEAVNRYGPATFAAYNAMQVPRLASGGLAGLAAAALPALPRSSAPALAPVHLHLPGVSGAIPVSATPDAVAQLQRAVNRAALKHGRRNP